MVESNKLGSHQIIFVDHVFVCACIMYSPYIYRILIGIHVCKHYFYKNDDTFSNKSTFAVYSQINTFVLWYHFFSKLTITRLRLIKVNHYSNGIGIFIHYCMMEKKKAKVNTDNRYGEKDFTRFQKWKNLNIRIHFRNNSGKSS